MTLPDSDTDAYETPELTDYGTIEEWTKGPHAQIVTISIII